MPDAIRFEVKGLRQLGEAFKELADDVQGRLGARTTSAMSKPVREGVKQKIQHNASKDGDSIDTGSLLASIITKKLPKGQTASLGLTSAHIVVPRHRRSKRAKKTKQQTAPHAIFVEFGTVNMPAEPNLQQGLAANINPATNAGKEKLRVGIEQVARKRGAIKP